MTGNRQHIIHGLRDGIPIAIVISAVAAWLKPIKTDDDGAA